MGIDGAKIDQTTYMAVPRNFFRKYVFCRRPRLPTSFHIGLQKVFCNQRASYGTYMSIASVSKDKQRVRHFRIRPRCSLVTNVGELAEWAEITGVYACLTCVHMDRYATSGNLKGVQVDYLRLRYASDQSFDQVI